MTAVLGHDPATPAAAPKVHPFAVTHRLVLAIAVPMTLAHLATPFIGITDTAVIGRLGDAALLGAVGIGAILFDFLGTTFNFIRMGTTGLTAQAYGAEDEREQVAVLARALLLAIGFGLAIVVLQAPILWVSLQLMGASEAVSAAATTYFHWRVWGTPLMLANYAILGWLLGRALTGTGLAIQILLAATNIVLSIVFVMGLGMGVAGVAAASVLAELAALMAGLLAVLRQVTRMGWPHRAAIVDAAGFRRMIAINRDIMVRSVLLILAFSMFTAASARSGDVVLAANAILMNFFLLGGFFLDGIATACEQLAGRSIGARYRPAFERTVRLTTVWSFALAGLLSAFFLLAGPALIDLMTTSPEVRDAARRYLPWAAFTPLAGVLAFQMDGIYIGSTWGRDMRNMMIVSFVAFLLVLWLVAPPLGNHGLWLAIVVFLSMRGITLAARLSANRDRTFAAFG